MTVQELINKLQKIEDKSKQVCIPNDDFYMSGTYIAEDIDVWDDDVNIVLIETSYTDRVLDEGYQKVEESEDNDDE